LLLNFSLCVALLILVFFASTKIALSALGFSVAWWIGLEMLHKITARRIARITIQQAAEAGLKKVD
jgi:hypothetical protein